MKSIKDEYCIISPTWNIHINVIYKPQNLPAMQETWVISLGWEDPLRRAWQPTPIFLPGEFHRQRSLAGYSTWGHRVRHD